MSQKLPEKHVGIKILVEPPKPEGNTIVDVVAIHGIGAHPDETWCEDVGQDGNSAPLSVNWLQDPGMLPLAMKDARIMRYGYRSEWFGRDALIQNASTIAPDLLDALNRTRKECPTRPLIFIAHSFGGLVVLRTLLKAQIDETQWPGIFASTAKIVFFGTPFKGSKALHPMKMVEAALSQHESYAVLPEVMHGLEPGTEHLRLLVEDFLNIWRLRQKKIKILCFFEQKPSSISSIVGEGPKRREIVVTQDEGCLESSTAETINRALPRSHFQMNKFSTPTDAGFETMCDFLTKVEDETEEKLEALHSKPSTKIIEMTNEEEACLRSLCFPEMNWRKNDVADPAETTCVWLSEHKLYLKWLNQQHGLLWIKGIPGAGKSTVMRRVITIAEKEGSLDRSVIASFFFHGRGAEIQKSPLGLFRSLLHQILQQIPGLLLSFSSLFKKRCATEGRIEKQWSWQTRDLQDFFQNHVVDASREHPIKIYVDALDECGEEIATQLYEFFQVITSKASLSICFSCRHYPLISLDAGLEIYVEDENHHDIEVYVQKMLKSHVATDSTNNEIQKETLERSHGSFQWVVLVISRVRKGYKKGKSSLAMIKKSIQTIPSELNELYRTLLQEIPDEDLPHSLHLMQWICFAMRPLSVQELRFALMVDANTSYRSIHECQEAEEYATTNDEMEKRVLDLSRGLAEIKEQEGVRVAQFIHQSVNDYLIQGGLQILHKSSSENVIGAAHFRLTRSCMRYVAMQEIRDCLSGPNPDIARTKFPFLRYAVKSWLPHAEEVEDENIAQEDLLLFFFQSSSNFLQNWVELNRERNYARHESPGCVVLHIATRNNLRSVVPAVLDLHSVDVDALDPVSRTPLSWAAMYGYDAIVNLLLDRGANVDHRDFRGKSPLSWATQCGEDAIVELLLNRGANVHTEDRLGRTPLQWAIFKKRETMIRLLLDRGAEVEPTWFVKKYSLSRAITMGSEAVTKLLLTLSGNDIRWMQETDDELETGPFWEMESTDEEDL